MTTETSGCEGPGFKQMDVPDDGPALICRCGTFEEHKARKEVSRLRARLAEVEQRSAESAKLAATLVEMLRRAGIDKKELVMAVGGACHRISELGSKLAEVEKRNKQLEALLYENRSECTTNDPTEQQPCGACVQCLVTKLAEVERERDAIASLTGFSELEAANKALVEERKAQIASRSRMADLKEEWHSAAILERGAHEATKAWLKRIEDAARKVVRIHSDVCLTRIAGADECNCEMRDLQALLDGKDT